MSEPDLVPATAALGPLVDALSSEVVRKLRLASEAETRDDREVVCEEVFCDVTGLLDEHAQVQLGLAGPVPFYQVLARHYAAPRGADTAVALLHLLQGLYGQGYAAPLVALLLHRWLLVRRTVGRAFADEKATRLANVLCLGAAQLFLGDVHGGGRAFEPLWRCLCYEVVLGQAPFPWGHGSGHNMVGGEGVDATPADPSSPVAPSGLAALPPSARASLLSAVAAFLVYYAPPEHLEVLLQWLPPPTATPAPLLPLQASGSLLPDAPAPPGTGGGRGHGHRTADSPAPLYLDGQPCWPPLTAAPWEGVEFLMLQVVDMLSRIRSEAGLVRYLEGLGRLGPCLASSTPPHTMRLTTRLRLQGVLYALGSPGGPHYAPKAVRAAALAALDELFPGGRTTRALVRMLFRVLHPTDWLGELAGWVAGAVRAGLTMVVSAALTAVRPPSTWLQRRPAQRRAGSSDAPTATPPHGAGRPRPGGSWSGRAGQAAPGDETAPASTSTGSRSSVPKTWGLRVRAPRGAPPGAAMDGTELAPLLGPSSGVADVVPAAKGSERAAGPSRAANGGDAPGPACKPVQGPGSDKRGEGSAAGAGRRWSLPTYLGWGARRRGLKGAATPEPRETDGSRP